MKQVSVRILEGPHVADVLLRGGESRIDTLVDAAVDVISKVRGVLGVTASGHSTTRGVSADVNLGDGADENQLRIALSRLTPKGEFQNEKVLQ